MIRINRHGEQGFSLIEMAIVILVIGLAVRGMFSFLVPQSDSKIYQLTVERQKKVAIALSNYVQQMNILPCPAAPNSSPLGTARFSCNSDADRNGVVPYRILGITQEDATDGYGNPFTYAVTRDATVTNVDVYNGCGSSSAVWFNPSTMRNYNALKARFCCQQTTPGTEMRVFSDAHMSTLVTDGQAAIPVSCFQDPDNPGMNACFPDPAHRLTYMAYVLIGHGKNRVGSYTWGANGRKAGTAGAEAENADDDMRFITMPVNENDDDIEYFDDIVLWRTQQQAMNELSNTDCAHP